MILPSSVHHTVPSDRTTTVLYSLYHTACGLYIVYILVYSIYGALGGTRTRDQRIMSPLL